MASRFLSDLSPDYFFGAPPTPPPPLPIREAQRIELARKFRDMLAAAERNDSAAPFETGECVRVSNAFKLGTETKREWMFFRYLDIANFGDRDLVKKAVEATTVFWPPNCIALGLPSNDTGLGFTCIVISSRVLERVRFDPETGAELPPLPDTIAGSEPEAAERGD